MVTEQQRSQTEEATDQQQGCHFTATELELSYRGPDKACPKSGAKEEVAHLESSQQQSDKSIMNLTSRYIAGYETTHCNRLKLPIKSSLTNADVKQSDEVSGDGYNLY